MKSSRSKWVVWEVLAMYSELQVLIVLAISEKEVGERSDWGTGTGKC